jgi:hypothetical protein
MGLRGLIGHRTARVLRVELHTLTGKRQETRIVKVMARRTAEVIVALDNLVASLDAGNAIDGDGMFTRRPNWRLEGWGTGRTLKFRSKRVTEAVKVSSERLGLSKALYSAHSFRKGGAEGHG